MHKETKDIEEQEGGNEAKDNDESEKIEDVEIKTEGKTEEEIEIIVKESAEGSSKPALVLDLGEETHRHI